MGVLEPFLYTFLTVCVLVLILAGCAAVPPVTPTVQMTRTPTEIERATLAAPRPTATARPTQAPPVPLTAQPAPDVQPTAAVVTVTAGSVPPLKGDVPGLLSKPLEQPGQWQQVNEMMDGLPAFAWRCENEAITSLFRPAQEAIDLIGLLDDKPALDKAVAGLKAQGFQVMISRPLVFDQHLADLPFDQLADCRVQAALALFDPAPERLPRNVGLVLAGRTGQVEGRPAYERIWIVLWK